MSKSSKPAVVGAAPAGADNVHAVSRAVRDMFTSVAPRYDLLNHVLSCNVDRRWWRRAAGRFGEILRNPNAKVLDLCCGTGDMTFALRREAGNSTATIIGADFSHAMLDRARRKSLPQPEAARPGWVEADALGLPLAGAYFDLVTTAFGFRNLADYDAGLREILRVLKPGGECGILDFCEPKGVIGIGYRFYFKHVLPQVGTLISGVRGPYSYLPDSVARFPEPAAMVERMQAAGFSEASWTPYTFGIAGMYWGKK